MKAQENAVTRDMVRSVFRLCSKYEEVGKDGHTWRYEDAPPSPLSDSPPPPMEAPICI